MNTFVSRFYVQFQKKQEYKTLNLQINSSRSKSTGQRLPAHVEMHNTGNDASLELKEQACSIYAEQLDLTHADSQVRTDDANTFDVL